MDDNGNEIARSNETLPDTKTEARNYKEFLGEELGNVRVKTFTFEPGELGSCKNDDGTNNAEVLALAKACGYGKSIPEGDQCCLDYGCDADCQW